MAHCTCRGGDHDECALCASFARWEYDLPDAERGLLAVQFIDELKTAHGVVRGDVKSRAPYFGNEATVEFNGGVAFGDFLYAHFASTFDTRAAA